MKVTVVSLGSSPRTAALSVAGRGGRRRDAFTVVPRGCCVARDRHIDGRCRGRRRRKVNADPDAGKLSSRSPGKRDHDALGQGIEVELQITGRVRRRHCCVQTLKSLFA